MVTSLQSAVSGIVSSQKWSDVAPIVFLLALAAVLRVLFFSGAVGSDDVIYVTKSLDLLNGNWDASAYVGAQRYGVHIPMAFVMLLFGVSEFKANLWPLVASLGEIAAVWWLANRYLGKRVALYAALFLAVVPLHVNLSGRLLADTPMMVFLTAAFVFFIHAEISGQRRFYVYAGIAVGCSFWIKQSVTLLMLPILFFYALSIWRVRTEWLLLAGAALVVSAGYWLLLFVVSGDPAYMLETRTTAFSRNLDTVTKDFSAWTYFWYLFADIKHTFLLGPLVVLGCYFAIRNPDYQQRAVSRMIILWGLGFLAILSFTIVSTEPLRFIQKQSNYMIIFTAPFCLLAAIGIHNLGRVPRVILLAIFLSGSVVLSALQQQAIRVFAANSVAAQEFAAATENDVYSLRQATSLSYYWERLENGGEQVRTGAILQLPATEPRIFPPHGSAEGFDVFFILDEETMEWSGGFDPSASGIPECWKDEGTLAPGGFGLGKSVLRVIRQVAAWGPKPLSDKVLAVTDRYYEPRPATVYRIHSSCQIDLSDY